MADLRALVVDNSPVVCQVLRYVLEAEGWTVDIARDGLEALDCIAGRRPDLIVTDLIMPRIDGSKLCAIVRNTPDLCDIFLIVLSGVAMEDDAGTRDLGADVCIAKGTATAMQAHVRAALEKFRAGERRLAGVEGVDGLFPREVIRELLVSNRHRDVVLARMTEGVVELDREGRVVMANGAASELFALPEVQVLGQSLARLLPTECGARVEAWLAALKQGAPLQVLEFDYEEPILLVDRQVTGTLVPVAEEATFFVIGILQDVTRRKELEAHQRRLERELQRIQKLDAMSTMACGIAHDFNNLLTVISGNLEMARFVSRDAEVNRLLGESARALDLTVQLIHKFTTFSDNYLPCKSSVCLHGLVEEVLERELASTRVSHRVRGGDEALAIALDPALIRQVFANLARNAADAINGTGHIEVTLDRVNGRAEAARTSPPLADGAFVRVGFRDSGPGSDAATSAMSARMCTTRAVSWPPLRIAAVCSRTPRANASNSGSRTAIPSSNVGSVPDSIASRSTHPGPTDGSWSTSPTRINSPFRGTARNRCTASCTSIMLVSSTISASVSSGCRASCRNRPVPGS